ncbi:MAG: cytochrome b/b6 domain-containing protein [Rhodocyclaceae bacterium]|nr:cytochrome b/b6 domain-containing protein [Rhodocyclaceae bacterium]
MSKSPPRLVKVFDPVLRLTHWWIVLSIMSLVTTSQLAELLEHGPREVVLWEWHIVSGYALTAGLAMRVIWGLIGPATARWSDLWHPSAWAGLLRLHWPAVRRGHDVAASLVFLLFYGLVAVMLITGFGLSATEFATGPLASIFDGTGRFEWLFEEPHEVGFVLTLVFISVHLGALVFHQLRGERVAQAMVTGEQCLAKDSGAGHE